MDYIEKVLPLASSNGIPVIATNDVIFSNKEDYDIHETKVCINTGKTLNDPNREKNFSDEQFLSLSNKCLTCLKIMKNFC